MKKMRIFSVALAACMAVGAAAGCSGGGDKGDYAVKVGILAPTSGAVSSYGQAAKNGAELAIKHANESKMFDKEIVSVHMDEKGKAEEAVTAFDRLVNEQKIDVLIGDVTSGPSIDVAKEAASVGIPMMTPTGTAAAITEGKDNVFRACFLDATQGKAMADFASSQNFKKIAIIFNQDDEYSIGLKDAFKAQAQSKGIEIVSEQAYASGDKDFKAQLTTIDGTSPDAIYMPDYYNTVSTICQQKKNYANIKDVPALGADGWDGVLGIEGVDKSVLEGAFFTHHYAMEDQSEQVQNFVKAYREEYGKDPASFAALAYDATNMMLQAVKNAGSTDYDKVVAELKKLEYTGVTGTITFDANGDPIKPISIVEIKDGKYTLNASM